MKFYMDSQDGPTPKRGDIIHTNVGDKRERTCLILRATRRQCGRRSFNIVAARWWELEPEMRMALFKSAQRNGGQNIHHWRRYPAKPKRKTFEQEMTELFKKQLPFRSTIGTTHGE